MLTPIKKHWKLFIILVLVLEAAKILNIQTTAYIRKTFIADSIVFPLFVFPPEWVFYVAWFFIYVLLAFAVLSAWYNSAIVCKRRSVITVFVLQVILTLVWELVFWGCGIYWGGVVIIAALDILTLFAIWLYWRCCGIAGISMIVCFIWFLVATYLSVGVAIMFE